MTAPIQINRRRNRQQTRRVLARLVVEGRDLTESSFLKNLDLIDKLRSLASNDNRK